MLYEINFIFKFYKNKKTTLNCYPFIDQNIVIYVCIDTNMNIHPIKQRNIIHTSIYCKEINKYLQLDYEITNIVSF